MPETTHTGAGLPTTKGAGLPTTNRHGAGLPDTIVIGAGLSGLVTAIRLAQGGQKVTLFTFGIGGLQLSQGTIDILGYAPNWVQQPFKTIPSFVADHHEHPYGVIPHDKLRKSLTWLAELLPAFATGDPERNGAYPTALGAMRPTALVPATMAAGALKKGTSYAIVGLRQLKDFSPHLVAANLARTPLPTGGSVTATGYSIDLPAREGEADSNALAYARALDHPDYRARFAAAVDAAIGDEAVVGLPAILGLKDPAVLADVATGIGRPVFEIPLPPPGVPGMRLNEALTRIAREAGVRIVLGSRITGYGSHSTTLDHVTLHQAGREQAYSAADFVYAPGGFESGALRLDSHGTVTETVFGLPLRGLTETPLLTGDYHADQNLFRVGVSVDHTMRVLNDRAEPVYANLRVAGGIIQGAIRWREKSGEGIALGSAYAAADSILGRK